MKNTPLDPMYLCTTIIKASSKGGKTVTATGFFYDNHETGELYFVTNLHVVKPKSEDKDRSKNILPDSLTVILHDGLDMTSNTKYTVPLYSDCGQKRWFEHPGFGSEVDVVCIPIPNDDPIQAAKYGVLSLSHCLPSDVNQKWIDSAVMVGYPYGYYDGINNLPIVKSGYIASPYGVHHKGKPNFRLDAISGPGMSGSPVFTHRMHSYVQTDGKVHEFEKPERFFLGINSAERIVTKRVPVFFGDNKGYVELETPMYLNTVWYAYLIEEIINSIP